LAFDGVNAAFVEDICFLHDFLVSGSFAPGELGPAEGLHFQIQFWVIPESIECASLLVSLGVVSGRKTLVVHDEECFVGGLVVFREVGELKTFAPFFVVAFFFGDFSVLGPFRGYECPFAIGRSDLAHAPTRPEQVPGFGLAREVQLADLFAEVSFSLSGVEWYPLCHIVEPVPLIVVIVQDFGHHEGRDGELLDDGFIGGSPVFGGRPRSVVTTPFEEVRRLLRFGVARQRVEEDEVGRLHPRLVIAAVRSVEFCEFLGDWVVSSVGGRWEDGTAGVAHFVLERSSSPGFKLIL